MTNEQMPKKHPCKEHTEKDIELIYSGGSDRHPLPVCKKCGWIVWIKPQLLKEL